MFSATVTVGICSVLANTVLAVQHLVMANFYGTDPSLDAYLIALVIPTFGFSILAGSFLSSLMPEYIKVRENQGAGQAHQLFAGFILLGLAFAFLVAVLLAGVVPFALPFMCSGFSLEYTHLTLGIFFFLLPLVLFKGIGAIWSSGLYAEERFAIPALAPIMIPGAIILSIFVTADRLGVYSLVLGTLTGVLLEFSLLGAGIRKHRLPLLPRWKGLTPEIRKTMQQLLPMVAATFLLSSTDIIDQSMAAMLGPGNVSALSYGKKVVSFILGVGGMAVGTAVFPHFSTMIAHKDWKGLKRTLGSFTFYILLVTIPLTILLCRFSNPIISLVFERGAFSAADTLLVGKIQTFYLFQVPFFMLVIVGVRLLSALAKNQVIMFLNLVNLAANVAGNYIFMKIWGVRGISLSTSVVYALSSLGILVFLLFYFRKRDDSTRL